MLQSQATMHQFDTKEAMLKAFENISLRINQKTVFASGKSSIPRHEFKTGHMMKKTDIDPGQKLASKCYNCNTMGHIAAKCQLPRRERGACYKCFQTGHRAKECTFKDQNTKESTPRDGTGDKKTDVNSVFAEETNFKKRIRYQLCKNERQCEMECNFDTLLDTGSPISFMKDSHVPTYLIDPKLPEDNQYIGLNNSALEVKGRLLVKIAINNKEPRYGSLLLDMHRC